MCSLNVRQLQGRLKLWKNVDEAQSWKYQQTTLTRWAMLSQMGHAWCTRVNSKTKNAQIMHLVNFMLSDAILCSYQVTARTDTASDLLYFLWRDGAGMSERGQLFPVWASGYHGTHGAPRYRGHSWIWRDTLEEWRGGGKKRGGKKVEPCCLASNRLLVFRLGGCCRVGCMGPMALFFFSHEPTFKSCEVRLRISRNLP